MPNEQWAPLTLARTTSTPSDAQEGSIWWRSDLDQMDASDGNAGIPLTIGPTGNLPVIRSTAWHALPPVGVVGTANFPDARLFALPFWPGRACTLTGVAANVSLALAGGNLRFGVYESDGVIPTTLLADYGTVSAGVLGVRQINGLSTAIRPTLHYAVIARQGGLLNLGLTSRDTWDPIVSETAPTLGGNLCAYYRDGVAGALPASFGAIAGSIASPAISIQLT